LKTEADGIIWLLMNTSSPLVQIRPRSHDRYLRLPIFAAAWKIHAMVAGRLQEPNTSIHPEALQRLVPRFLRRGIRSFRNLTADDVQAVTRQFKARDLTWPKASAPLDVPAPRFEAEDDTGHALDRIIRRVVDHLRNDCGLAEQLAETSPTFAIVSTVHRF
jgi:hypothetical protein